ncbi:MAG TPA: DUF3131 domain-containing protein [Oculatellaceae cyanobacterium]|jgi:hypothetical protein
MMRQSNQRQWSKLTALLLIGTILQYWLPIYLKERSLAQTTSTTTCTALARPLKVQEQRHAAAAWNYFQANYEASTGLVSDRSDIKTSSIWGIGDYISALHTARSLNIISAQEFDQRTQALLTTLAKLPLVSNELPTRSFDTRSLQPVALPSQTTGWSALEIGRLLIALYNLKTCYLEYTNSIDSLVLKWSYLRVVRDGRLSSAVVINNNTEVYPENRLGYEEYAARGFQLWGFEVYRSAVGGKYQTASIEGINVPTKRIRPDINTEVNQYTVSNPFLLYGVELGLDPQMRQLFEPIRRAQTERYRKTGQFTAAGKTVIPSQPDVVNSTVISGNQPWATTDNNGTPVKSDRTVSTAVAFALNALYPEDPYTVELLQATTDLYNPSQGYYEGFSEQTSQPVIAFTSSTNSLILQSLLYRTTNQQPIVSNQPNLNSPWWQAISQGDANRGLPITTTQKVNLISKASGAYWVSNSSYTSPVAFVPSNTATPPQLPTTTNKQPIVPTPTPTKTPSTQPIKQPIATSLPRLTKDADQTAAQIAWKYFERNWNPKTGLVNAVENLQWTTLWDQGSAILGIHAAYQLGLINKQRFNSMMTVLLQTLEKLPLPTTRLPNKAYSTSTAQMRKLNNTPDPKGISGWSVLDLSRFMMGLYVIKTQYPEYSDRVNRIVSRWDLSKLVKNGFLYGGVTGKNNKIEVVQEGRLGYEQYAANILKQWNIQATNALNNPPVKTVEVEGIPLKVDQRNLANSNATNYLTNDPYLLWGLEIGWSDGVKPQVMNLLKAQVKRFERTGILTAVNEDGIDRQPYFLYYSVYSNGEPWQAVNVTGKSFPNLRFLSTKAAFAWSALMNDDPYAKKLRNAVQNLIQPNRGYFSGRYENPQLGVNNAVDVNTNAIILESLLYQARGARPLSLK